MKQNEWVDTSLSFRGSGGGGGGRVIYHSLAPGGVMSSTNLVWPLWILSSQICLRNSFLIEQSPPVCIYKMLGERG